MSLIIKENEHLTVENIGTNHLVLQDYASITHIFNADNNDMDLTIDLGLGASYNAVFLQNNNRLKITVNLNKPQARTDIASMFMTNDKQKCEIFVNHNASNTYSNQLFKGLAYQDSVSDITLKTVVNKDLKGIEAYQLMRGIVMGEKSAIKSIPFLDIYSDDVICSHGSAIGTINEDQLFYMQSRGLSKPDATKILISAFGEEVIDKAGEDNKLQQIFTEYLKDIR